MNTCKCMRIPSFHALCAINVAIKNKPPIMVPCGGCCFNIRKTHTGPSKVSNNRVRVISGPERYREPRLMILMENGAMQTLCTVSC